MDIYRNPHARYVSPALLIPKPVSPGEFRLCVDVKQPNELFLQTHWPKPYIYVVLKNLSKISAYAKLDAFKEYGYFFLQLSAENYIQSKSRLECLIQHE